MENSIVFVVLSLPIILLSWRTLFNPRHHGFYRFFGWEGILWLLVSNLKYWFNHPFGVPQLFSWICLFTSLYLVIAGAIQLKKRGKPDKNRNDQALYQFEKTSELIDSGIYKYIRHPLYAALISITWGIFLNQVTSWTFVFGLLSTFFIVLTAVSDEQECLNYFGEKYRAYMKQTKRFIPFVI